MEYIDLVVVLYAIAVKIAMAYGDYQMKTKHFNVVGV